MNSAQLSGLENKPPVARYTFINPLSSLRLSRLCGKIRINACADRGAPYASYYRSSAVAVAWTFRPLLQS
jgi:hypothetical protein